MKTGLLQPLTNIELQQNSLHYKVTTETNHNHYGEVLKIIGLTGVTDYAGYPNYPNGVDSNLTFSIGSGKQIVFNNKNNAAMNAAYDADSGMISAVKFLANPWTSDSGSNSGGYSFVGDGNYDTGMFSTGDGQLVFKSNAVARFSTSASSSVVNFYGNVSTIQNSGFTFGTQTTGLYLNSIGNLVLRLNGDDIVRTTGSYNSATSGTDLMIKSNNMYVMNRLLIGANFPDTNMFNAESSSTNSIQMLSSTNVGGIHNQHTSIIMSATLGITRNGYDDNWYPEFTIRGATDYATYGVNLLKVNRDGVFQYGSGGYEQLASRLFTTGVGAGNNGKILVVDASAPSNPIIAWKTAAEIFTSGITVNDPLSKSGSTLGLKTKSYFTIVDGQLALLGATSSDNNVGKFLKVAGDSALTWDTPTAATIYADNKSIIGDGTSSAPFKITGVSESQNYDKYLHLYQSNNTYAMDWKTANEIVATGLDANSPIYVDNGKVSIYTASASQTGALTSTSYTQLVDAYAAAVTNATDLNTASTIVKRDASGNFSAGTITASLNGNASTASKIDGTPSSSTIIEADNLMWSYNGTSQGWLKFPTFGTISSLDLPDGWTEETPYLASSNGTSLTWSAGDGTGSGGGGILTSITSKDNSITVDTTTSPATSATPDLSVNNVANRVSLDTGLLLKQRNNATSTATYDNIAQFSIYDFIYEDGTISVKNQNVNIVKNETFLQSDESDFYITHFNNNITILYDDSNASTNIINIKSNGTEQTLGLDAKIDINIKNIMTSNNSVSSNNIIRINNLLQTTTAGTSFTIYQDAWPTQQDSLNTSYFGRMRTDSILGGGYLGGNFSYNAYASSIWLNASYLPHFKKLGYVGYWSSTIGGYAMRKKIGSIYKYANLCLLGHSNLSSSAADASWWLANYDTHDYTDSSLSAIYPYTGYGNTKMFSRGWNESGYGWKMPNTIQCTITNVYGTRYFIGNYAVVRTSEPTLLFNGLVLAETDSEFNIKTYDSVTESINGICTSLTGATPPAATTLINYGFRTDLVVSQVNYGHYAINTFLNKQGNTIVNGKETNYNKIDIVQMPYTPESTQCDVKLTTNTLTPETSKSFSILKYSDNQLIVCGDSDDFTITYNNPAL